MKQTPEPDIQPRRRKVGKQLSFWSLQNSPFSRAGATWPFRHLATYHAQSPVKTLLREGQAGTGGEGQGIRRRAVPCMAGALAVSPPPWHAGTALPLSSLRPHPLLPPACMHPVHLAHEKGARVCEEGWAMGQNEYENREACLTCTIPVTACRPQPSCLQCMNGYRCPIPHAVPATTPCATPCICLPGALPAVPAKYLHKEQCITCPPCPPRPLPVQYLQYKNARPDYLKEVWKVVNWRDVGRRFEAATGASVVVS